MDTRKKLQKLGIKDNYFLESVGRFTEVEEDEEILHPLWNEI